MRAVVGVPPQTPIYGANEILSNHRTVVGTCYRAEVLRWHFFPRFSCFLRLASRRSGGEVRPNQILVGQALVHDGAYNLGEAPAIVFLPMVEAESLLVQIAEHVEGVNADVGAFDGALEQAPEALQGVRVNEPNRVGLSVVDD